MLKPNNPITYNDIERCPYHYTEEPRYSLWCRKDDERLEKIRHSWLRFLWRLFAPNSWHPSSNRVKEIEGRFYYIQNSDIWI